MVGPGRDFRLVALAAATWAGSLSVALAGRVPVAEGRYRALGIALAVCLVAVVIVVIRRPRLRAIGAGCLLIAAAAGLVADVRAAAVDTDPIADLARLRQWVSLTGTVVSDPRVVTGGRSTGVVVRVTVRHFAAPQARGDVNTPVVVLGPPAWRALRLGARIRFEGRLSPPSDPGIAALVTPRRAGPEAIPTVAKQPGLAWQVAAAVRRAVRASVAGRPPDQAALVPALVDGDDADVSADLAADFRTTGLTHLMAVSGTNLTLLVGALLWAARWLGVRGRWLHTVAALGIAGFIVVARAEPSVVRAAAMGIVGLIAIGSGARSDHALRALGAAVVVLVLVDPAMATSVGFALSVLATGGIVAWAPAWRDALAAWMPRALAEMIAVPLAAQLACTPVIAALSGRVSLVAVAANMAAEPVVGPATVAGLLGGLVTLVCPPLGRCLGWVAGLCCGWIATVARHSAGLVKPDIGWGAAPLAIAVLTIVVVVIAILGPRWVRRPIPVCGVVLALGLIMTVRPPSPGWPPKEWVFVACDVGQGDGLVLATGPGTAIVIDAGPDPRVMRRCLDGLGVRRIDLAVMTHFHADHVDGLAGALAGRSVGAIETTRLQDPPAGVREVNDVARRLGVTVTPAPVGETRRFGDVDVQVLWPPADSPVEGPGDGSTANESSVVLLVQTHGLRLLLTGDVEPLGQAVLARQLAGLTVDVLKVPHHGSRYQDLDWQCSLHARIGVISVGADNDYGHPAASTVEGLQRCGLQVHRTDREGAIAVTADGQVVTSRR